MSFQQSTPAPGILVVDDEDAVRSVISRALRRAGFTVFDAATGEHAAAVAASMEPLALALVDVALGAERGPAIVKRLRAERPNLRVAYISGQSPEQLLDAAEDAVATFLPKPFDAEGVVGFVRQLLDAPREQPAIDPTLLFVPQPPHRRRWMR